VQRLFSTFANGWPGRGLLIQRLLVGGVLVYWDFQWLSATPGCRLAIHQSVAALAGAINRALRP
jgi:putative oxidoreductase